MADDSDGFQIALPGEFGPALLAWFAAHGACRAETSSVFLLEVTDELGIPAITEMLQARGLEVLDVRRVHPPRRAPGLTRAG